ncbi:MAG: aminodeoxychorismate/anthranilate synthase component II [Alphaproteobacteria bacterium]|nr:aminodeoxychorismate/anthranilate synthase component II [Alphaproteobacteria bacterium]
MKILLLDNYDSFTYNLLHYLAELGAEVEVRRNDAVTVDSILASPPEGIVISPGPGAPKDSGICLELVMRASGRIPLLGVCLGHQAIGEGFGGRVIRAQHPMHGKTSDIIHHGKGIFAGLPSPFQATRYHSLIVERQTLPDCLEITAETQDGVIMGLMHKQHPTHGVQFHPESIASAHGHDIIRNFLNLL